MLRRNLTDRLLASLRDTPVVYLQGARQTGKSTLAQSLKRRGHKAQYFSLDSSAVLAAALSDPEGFVAGLEGPVIIDEVQRAPALALAIKSAVDANRQPGRFLLTGSASVLTLPRLAESLAGRIELHTLWPFSQGEIKRHRETFIDRAFARKPVAPGEARLADSRLIQRVTVGGFPESLARKDASRRDAWFDSYVTTILERDVRDLANIERLADIPRLLTLLATRPCGLLNFSDLARSLNMPQSTLKRYLALLEATFLVRLLPAWATNLGKRLVKSPKLLLTDTGLLTHLLQLSPARLRADRTLYGTVLENFVAMELIKQSGWSATRCKLFHFRAESGHEVDIVLEDSAGRIVGIEVKASAAASPKDFNGMRALAELAGERFVQGLVLCNAPEAVPFAANLKAAPLSSLWA